MDVAGRGHDEIGPATPLSLTFIKMPLNPSSSRRQAGERGVFGQARLRAQHPSLGPSSPASDKPDLRRVACAQSCLLSCARPWISCLDALSTTSHGSLVPAWYG
jgi:hypothetical protein